MPLVRVQVRNEYGLGQPELYTEANREDPKAVLDGVAVAGLAGILRQLGDLAEFAAEVFHGLQEQVMTTSSRSHKIMVRLQRIEAALPPLEKAILSQKSHLHFAYTAGSVWHAHHKTEQNQFIYSDLPHFIMDSYEECRDPPRLQLLDKFDTGGPGSCLKRYSDPTFFRRASASSSEANVEKVSKDRKARRKKSRTRQRNEVPHGASISNHSDRTQFASLKDDGQVSCSQTVSAFDAIFNSEHGDQSNSFDSRTGSGFIECVFRPTYSMKPEEQEPNNSSFPSSKMHHNAIIDSPVYEHSGVVDVDFPHSKSEEQTGPSSSCVTWVEKTEIVEPLGHHQYDHDESAEMLTVNFGQMLTPEKDAPMSEKDAINFRNVEQMDFQLGNEDTPTSVSGRNHMDDIESEADNYVDALNTIESESETDLDYQTKREVEQSSNFSNHEETQDGINGLIEHRSNRQSSNLEFCKAGYRSSNIAISGNEAVSTQTYANKESPQIKGKSPEISPFLGMDSGDNSLLDGSNEVSIVRNLPSSGLTEPNRMIPMSDKIISTSCESQKSTPEPSQSVKFWTNGGLLGLEPSKPPVFSVSNAAIQDYLTRNNNDIAGPSSESWVVNGDGHAGKPDKLVQSSKICELISCNGSTSRLNDQYGQSDKKVSQRLLSTDVDTNYEKLSLSQTTAVKPGTEQAVTANVKAISPEASQRDGENESQIFGFGNRFLINGFQRKRSVVHGEKFEALTSTKTGDFEEKSRNHSVAYQTFSGRNLKGYFENESPMSSPSSSPPLQHMKISFQPINGFEISKLKLKFPDGSYSHDGSRDMLPSFQLVPEAATPQHAIGSESDDDTFCRSSPYMSDDCHSHHSDSNSEQWDSDDTPPSKNNELYDALRRISSTETVSSSLEHDLPSLSTLNPLFDQEKKNGSDARDFPESDIAEGPTPVPPPLPPLEWRVTKSHSDLTTHMQDTVSETVNRELEMKNLGSSVSPQPKPSPSKQQQNTVEAIADTPKSLSEWQKLNGKKEIDQATNDRGDDEKEDFLQQIRAKSFNLRRTATEKATIASGPTANVKVAAILEKANAIRQAVGSDDGEDDDNWSDA